MKLVRQDHGLAVLLHGPEAFLVFCFAAGCFVG
jgi:hypothetical protein